MAEQVSDLNSIKLFLGLDDTDQDKLLTAILDDSETQVEAYLNQDHASATVITLPSSYSWITRRVAIKRFNRIGDEGKTSASESDVSTTWESSDLDEFTRYLDPLRVRRGGQGIARFI